MIRFTIPGVRLVSEANERGRWSKHAGRTQSQRQQAATVARSALASLYGKRGTMLDGPLVVTIVRIAPTRLDSDNLVGSAKHIRDGVADALGIDDRDPRVTWHVEQRRGGVRVYGVEVTIAAAVACPHCGSVRGAA